LFWDLQVKQIFAETIIPESITCGGIRGMLNNEWKYKSATQSKLHNAIKLSTK
jgi:hypothetical protein